MATFPAKEMLTKRCHPKESETLEPNHKMVYGLA